MLLTEHVLACCFLRLAVRPVCSNHSQQCPAPALMSTMPLHGRLGLHLSFLSLGAAHRHFPLPSGAAPLSNFKALHKLQRIHKIHKLHKTSKALWVGFAQRVVGEHEKISPFLVFAQSFHSFRLYSSDLRLGHDSLQRRCCRSGGGRDVGKRGAEPHHVTAWAV